MQASNRGYDRTESRNTMIMDREPTNAEEALTMGLVLAVTAPTDALAREVLESAQRIAWGLDEATVKRCMAAAEVELAMFTSEWN